MAELKVERKVEMRAEEKVAKTDMHAAVARGNC